MDRSSSREEKYGKQNYTWPIDLSACVFSWSCLDFYFALSSSLLLQLSYVIEADLHEFEWCFAFTSKVNMAYTKRLTIINQLTIIEWLLDTAVVQSHWIHCPIVPDFLSRSQKGNKSEKPKHKNIDMLTFIITLRIISSFYFTWRQRWQGWNCWELPIIRQGQLDGQGLLEWSWWFLGFKIFYILPSADPETTGESWNFQFAIISPAHSAQV